MDAVRHVRLRWPEPQGPEGEPLWLLYQIDDLADAVIRSVDLFPDGTATRNSIELEDRSGKSCTSLIETSLANGFGNLDLEGISAEEFTAAWAKAKDKPFWNVR